MILAMIWVWKEKYAIEVDSSATLMANEEYKQLMQTLYLRQSEICAHVMQWIQTKIEPTYIFIEGWCRSWKNKGSKSHL